MRTATINIRAREEERSLIDYATHFSLDAKEFKQFNQWLDAPVQHNPGLAKLMALKAPWESAKL